MEAESFKFQPKDRKYKSKGRKREQKMEIHRGDMQHHNHEQFGGGDSMGRLKIPSKRGVCYGYPGDSVGITFMKSGNAHTPVTHQMSRTITTFCGHDIGVITDEQEKEIVQRTGEIHKAIPSDKAFIQPKPNG